MIQETKFSIELLEMNLRHHKDSIKKFSKPIASDNKYIQNQLAWHIKCKNDLEKAIEILRTKN